MTLAPSLPSRVLALGLVGAIAVTCNTGPPTSPDATLTIYDERVPPKPGDSYAKSEMCSCTVCEPATCCRELEQDREGIDKDCADGYDFSKCETKVSSCGASCFQHRWRTRVEKGCDASRPTRCCHDQADF
jgi:hypothetical protein